MENYPLDMSERRFVLARNLFYIFNTVCCVTGLMEILGGISRYDQNATTIPTLLAMLGLVTWIACVVGFWGIIKKNRSVLITYTTMAYIVIVVHLLIGTLACLVLTHPEKTKYDSKLRLKTLISEYNSSSYSRQYIDYMQSELKCCGIDGPQDWGRNVPDSCCFVQNGVCWRIFAKGCFEKSNKHFFKSMHYIAALAITNVIFEILPASITVFLLTKKLL